MPQKTFQNIELEDVIRTFVPHPVVKIKLLKGGNVNQSYLAETAHGSYALQYLAPAIPSEAANAAVEVANMLNAAGLMAPRFLKDNTGGTMHTMPSGDRFRMYDFIPGKTYDVAPTPAVVQSAAHILQKTHAILAHQTPLLHPIPHFHDTPYIKHKLEERLERLPAEVNALGHDVHRELGEALLTPQEAGPNIPIHGDPKLSNFIFDDSDTAVGIIDLDTTMYHSKFIDIGDAMRSWCNPCMEDDPASALSAPYVEAFIAGYLGTDATLEERRVMLKATRLIALELSARFLIDVVDDNYFGFDAAKWPTRRAHNIARAQAQYNLAASAQHFA